MPPSPLPKKRHKVVRTYGKPSRSKLASFKVFQDVISEEVAEKRSWLDYEYSSHTVILDSLTAIGQAPDTESSIGLVNDLEDPFADPTALIERRSNPHSISSRRHWSKTAASTTTPPPQNSKGSLKMTALREKSTNHPVMIKSTASARLAYDSTPAITLHSSPKNHPTKKPRLEYTPRVTLDVQLPPPPRPRKYRHTVPILEGQDLLTILSPSKVRNPDSKSHFRKCSSIPEDRSSRPYNGQPGLLGIIDTDMNDSVNTGPRTWVRERAKCIFSGTKKAAEKILKASPSNARYKSQQKRGKLNLKEKIRIGTKSDFDVVVTNSEPRKVLKGKVGYRTAYNSVSGSNEDTVSLKDFLQDPFSHPEDCRNYHNMAIGEKGGDPFASPKTSECSHQRGLWRSESAQNLLMLGLMKVQNSEKERPFDPKYYTEDEDLSLFLATTNLSPGTAYDFPCSPSDNEMPSSSPMFKSTPRKEWHHPKSNDNPFNSDTGSIEDMAMGELLGRGSYDKVNRDEGSDGLPIRETDPRTWSFSGGTRANIEHRGDRYPILRAASSEDEFFDASYNKGIKNDFVECEKDNVDIRIGQGSGNMEEKETLHIVVATKTNDRNTKSEVNVRQKINRGLIHVGGSRTSKRAPKDRGPRKVMDGARGETALRMISGKNSSRGVGRGVVKKDIRKRKPSRGYEKLEIDDEVDELQMDLPAMMI